MPRAVRTNFYRSWTRPHPSLEIPGPPVTDKPDMIVTGVTLFPATPVTGDNVVFTATVQNIGLAPTPQGTIVDVLFTVTGVVNTTRSDTYVIAIPPGGTVTLTANAGDVSNAWSALQGNQTVTAFVNSANRFLEADTTNNTLVVPFYVAPAAGATAPSAPVLTGTPGNATVGLSWTVPANNGAVVLSYNVYKNAVLLTSVAASVTTYTDHAVVNGTAYTYAVSAVNVIGEGSKSLNQVVTPNNLAVPDAPVLAGTSGPTVSHLTWVAPANGGSAITGYRLNRNGVLLTSPGSAAVSFDDVGLTNGTTYTYTLAAVNAIGTSVLSNTITLTPIGLPAAPVLTAVSGVGQVALSWTVPAGNGAAISAYTIYRNNVLLAAPAGQGTTYTDTTGTVGVAYTYAVSATNSAGEGPKSATQSGTASAPTVPAAPVLGVPIPGNNSVSLSWTIPANGGSAITSYKVYRNNVFIGTEPFPDSPAYGDGGVTNGTTYSYQVTAVNAVGESLRSNTQTATPQATTIPALPADIVNGVPAIDVVSFGGVGHNFQSMSNYTLWKSWHFNGHTMNFNGDGNAQTSTQRFKGSSSQFDTTPGIYDSQRLAEGWGVVALNGGSQNSPNNNLGAINAFRQGIIKYVGPFLGTMPNTTDLPTVYDPAVRAKAAARIADIAAFMKYVSPTNTVVQNDWEGDGSNWVNPFQGTTHTLADVQTSHEQWGYDIGTAIYHTAGHTGCHWGLYNFEVYGMWISMIRSHNAGQNVGPAWLPTGSGDTAPVPNYTVVGGASMDPRTYVMAGLMRAHADYQATGRITVTDATFYHPPQYSGASNATALKWNTQGFMDFWSHYLPQAIWDQVAPYLMIVPFTWSGTDRTTFSTDGQFPEPTMTALWADCRKYSMGGYRYDYTYGGYYGTPGLVTGNPPYTQTDGSSGGQGLWSVYSVKIGSTVVYGNDHTSPIANEVQANSAVSITVPHIPAGTGIVDVVVTTSKGGTNGWGGTSATSSVSHFNYGDGGPDTSTITAATGPSPPIVTSISPSSGPAGTTLTINGSNFMGNNYQTPSGRIAAMQPTISPTTQDSTAITVGTIAQVRNGTTATLTFNVLHPFGMHHVTWILYQPSGQMVAAQGEARMTFNNGGGSPAGGIPNSSMDCVAAIPNAPAGSYVILDIATAIGQHTYRRVLLT